MVKILVEQQVFHLLLMRALGHVRPHEAGYFRAQGVGAHFQLVELLRHAEEEFDEEAAGFYRVQVGHEHVGFVDG